MSRSHDAFSFIGSPHFKCLEVLEKWTSSPTKLGRLAQEHTKSTGASFFLHGRLVPIQGQFGIVLVVIVLIVAVLFLLFQIFHGRSFQFHSVLNNLFAFFQFPHGPLGISKGLGRLVGAKLTPALGEQMNEQLASGFLLLQNARKDSNVGNLVRNVQIQGRIIGLNAQVAGAVFGNVHFFFSIGFVNVLARRGWEFGQEGRDLLR
mmetsp:Transcript_26907/g.61911  ORF Transcript_26907/g.61911 Transcript_26907/m.61911 type:complete len:205 (-) Transcript_26907:1045-1659(-)